MKFNAVKKLMFLFLVFGVAPKVMASEYTVQLAAKTSLDEAEKIRAELKSQGFEVELERYTKKDVWYRVTVGKFKTESEAQAFVASRRLASKFSDIWIRKQQNNAELVPLADRSAPAVIVAEKNEVAASPETTPSPVDTALTEGAQLQEAPPEIEPTDLMLKDRTWEMGSEYLAKFSKFKQQGAFGDLSSSEISYFEMDFYLKKYFDEQWSLRANFSFDPLSVSTTQDDSVSESMYVYRHILALSYSDLFAVGLQWQEMPVLFLQSSTQAQWEKFNDQALFLEADLPLARLVESVDVADSTLKFRAKAAWSLGIREPEGVQIQGNNHVLNIEGRLMGSSILRSIVGLGLNFFLGGGYQKMEAHEVVRNAQQGTIEQSTWFVGAGAGLSYRF